MYAGDWAFRLTQLARSARPSSARAIPANVWGLGVTSFLTDISSEMVISVLPAYLVLMHGASPLGLGIANGLHEGGPVLATWLGGWVADRTGKRKLTAGCGYAISALSRVGWLLLSGQAIAPLATLIVGDRIGKAIRTAPRDALISLSAHPAQLAGAFGVHRAFDAAGAAIGPIAAWLLLWQLPHRYDVVFFASLVVAVLGVIALVLLVRERPPRVAVPQGWRQPWKESMEVFAHPPLSRVVIISIALGLVTIRDAFVYLLIVQRAQAGAHWIPLLYTGTALAFLVLAVPVGRLADGLGRARVFVLGHLCLIATYALATGGFGAWPVNATLCVVLLGGYYASTDGVLPSLAGSLLPPHVRSLGLAWVATGVGLARLFSSVMFGWLWTVSGDLTATLAFAIMLVIVMSVAWHSVRRLEGLATP